MRDEGEGEEVLGTSSSSSSGTGTGTAPFALPPPRLPAAALQQPLPRAPAATVCRPACALWQLRAVLVRNALAPTPRGTCTLPTAPYYTLSVCDAAPQPPPLPPCGAARAACAPPGVLVHTSERAPGRANPDWRDIDRAALRSASTAAAALTEPALCVCVWDRAPAGRDKSGEDGDVLLAARVVALRDLRFVAPLRSAETALAARQPFALLFVLGADIYAPAADVLAVTAATTATTSAIAGPESEMDSIGSMGSNDGSTSARRRLVPMCDAATLVALVGAHEALRTARAAAEAQRAALAASLGRAGGTARLRAERDARAARVAHLERELAAQQALLRAEDAPCRAAQHALVADAAALAAAEHALLRTDAAHTAARPRRAALAAARARAQHCVAQLQWRAVGALQEPYPIVSAENTSTGRTTYTISGTALGASEQGSSSIDDDDEGECGDEEDVAAALGACAHVLERAAAHLGVPLAYPVVPRGSRSCVVDPFAPGMRRLPLYSRGVDPALHRAAVRALQHDAALLLGAVAPAAAAPLPSSTLAVLHTLYEHAAAAVTTTPAAAAPPQAPQAPQTPASPPSVSST